MKLIVGLGNPGKEYKNTRHNVGFMILDHYLGKVDWKEKNEAYYYQTELNGEKVVFAKPITYMNLSGLAVKKYMKYYKLNINDLLVIQDDIDMSIGTYKLKKNSSSGGHNGIKSIIQELDTDEFLRLKIGIGKSDTIPVDKYVLGKLTDNELSKVEANYSEFDHIIEDFIQSNSDECLNEHNK